MADEPAKTDVLEPSEGESLPSDSTPGISWKKLFSNRWLVIVLAATFAINIAGFSYLQWRKAQLASGGVPEITLGQFRFENTDSSDHRMAQASFKLHISLLGESVGKARARLDARKYKVEQDVEQLLRQADSSDFDDPTLAELKRRIQERINKSLGMRAVSEVIITDLAVERTSRESVVGTASNPAWKQNSG